MFFSGALFGFWRPLDQRCRYLYAAAYDFSWRSGDVFLKTGLKAKGEQLYSPGLTLPDRFENVFEFHLAADIGETTVFITPQLCYNQEDLLGDNVVLRGETGLSFLLSQRSVAAVKLKGSYTLVPLHHRTASYGAEAGFSLYPDAPWFLTLTLGTLVQESDYTELVAGAPVSRLNHCQAYLTAELAASLSETLILKVLLPARMSFKSMPAVRDGAFTGDREWTLALGPEVELSVTLAPRHTLIFLLKAEPFFSNSDYYDIGYGECAVRYQIGL